MSLTNTRVYKSSDSGAPVLNGVVGSLISLLDACLVGTAGVAYGTTPSAGWTKAYTGTNKAAYRNDSTIGSGCYVRVDDAAPVTAAEARIRAYRTMSDVNTGTGPVPTVAQTSGGAVIRKAESTGTTPSYWILIADECTAYLSVHTTTTENWSTFAWFGDYISFVAGSGLNYGCSARSRDDYVNATIDLMGSLPYNQTTGTIYCGAMAAGSPTSLAGGFSLAGATSGWNLLANPAPITGDVLFESSRIFASSSIVGRLRGLYIPLCSCAGYSNGYTLTGITGGSGTSVLTILRGKPFGIVSGVAVESNDPWDLA